MSFDPDHKWVIEGGVEFIFNLFTLSYGWNSDMQLYELVEGTINELADGMDIYELDLGQHKNFEKVKNKKITAVKFDWNWYQQMTEEMEVSDEKTYIPQEIKMEFEDGTVLQFASVMFKIKDMQIHHPVFDSQGAMLVTVDQPMEISEAEV